VFLCQKAAQLFILIEVVVKLAEYKKGAKAQLGLRVSAKAEYSAATFKRIAEDAIFFR